MKQIWYIPVVSGRRVAFLPAAYNTIDKYIVIHCKEVTNTRHDQNLKKKTGAYLFCSVHQLVTRRCESDDTHLLTNNVINLHPMHITETEKYISK